ncbi:tetratricopeptide repeat protein [Planomonospora sp. ID82291]|uniref:tetratricopeptide repeat protein n=1 Tax=Planomonospora sp. ID82291 TaxID=2738136 RepID=UPI0018C38077|nr:tetratricopeptide repeat protein [Planomonospora sp. ID82291]MBG0818244.1 tetratricopeptide repeat protein [Planomonospora sp. ID82291]
MPEPSQVPDHRGAGEAGPPPAGPRRPFPLAAPAAAGVAAALASVLATSLDVWDLPTSVKVAVTACAGLLVGLLTWATAHRSAGAAAGEPGAAWRPPDQWPPVPAHFTGRRESLAELRGVFGARRRPRDQDGNASPLVVSVYGRGGVGKSMLITRFGHEVADRFPDGRLYADLRGAVDAPVRPEEVLAGFLRALGVRLTTDPGGLNELRRLWLTWTKGRRILIGLDNAQDGDQVKDLIPAEPGCAVMVTSRQPLFLLNTYDKRLSEFSEAQGVELLARLAGDDRVAADLEAAQEIVRMCDHLPLAISICGGRLATRENWSLRELADRLTDERRRLDQLELARRLDKSVRASLQLSYDDCTGIQRRLLRTLSLLTAPDVPVWVAGELLAASALDGADQLEALIDAQLAECSGVDFAGSMRYRLHDLVRIFARELSGADGPGGMDDSGRAAVERVLSGYRRRAEAAATARWPQDWGRSGRRADSAAAERAQVSAADWLNAERLTLVALINQARGMEMWELAWGLGRAFCSLCHSLRAYWSDWRAVAEIACEAAERMGDRRALGIALMDRAAVTGGQGGHRRARRDAERALEIFTGLGERWWAARAMRTVGMTLFSDGGLDRGQEHLTAAIAVFREEDDRWWAARTRRNLAELRLAQRRTEEARQLLEDALDVFERDRNRYSEAQTLRAYGEVLGTIARDLHERGEAKAAHEYFTRAGFSLDRAAEMFRSRGEDWEVARCLRAAGEVGNPANRLTELRYVRQAADLLTQLGDSWGVARTELSAGRVHARAGRTQEAVESLRSAVRAFEELGDRWWMARSLRRLGEVHLEAGDRQAADAVLTRAQDIYRSLGNLSGTGRTLELLRRARE